MLVNIVQTKLTVSRVINGINRVASGESNATFRNTNLAGVQADLRIDFTDLESPVVQSLSFAGELGDIKLDFDPSLLSLGNNSTGGMLTKGSINARPIGLRGFLRTRGDAHRVNVDGSFDASTTNFIANQGGIILAGAVGYSDSVSFEIDEAVNLADTPIEQFTDPISVGAINNVMVKLAEIAGDERIYDVIVTTALQRTELVFETSNFDFVADFSGRILAAGQIRLQIPEPDTATLLLFTAAYGLVNQRSRP